MQHFATTKACSTSHSVVGSAIWGELKNAIVYRGWCTMLEERAGAGVSAFGQSCDLIALVSAGTRRHGVKYADLLILDSFFYTINIKLLNVLTSTASR